MKSLLPSGAQLKLNSSLDWKLMGQVAKKLSVSQRRCCAGTLIHLTASASVTVVKQREDQVHLFKCQFFYASVHPFTYST